MSEHVSEHVIEHVSEHVSMHVSDAMSMWVRVVPLLLPMPSLLHII